MNGRVVWDPRKSLWFGSITLVAIAGAVPTFSLSAATLCAVSSAVILCVGHSVGVHRLLIHRAFRVPRALEYALVYVGVLVGLAGPLGLLQLHAARDHQQNQPHCHDYFAHRRSALVDYLWNLHARFESAGPLAPPIDAALMRDPFYLFLERTWRWQQVPWAVLLWCLGGWPWVIWGTFVRVAVSTFGHWFVGYVAHRRGDRHFHNVGAAVQGYNCRLLGALSMGEGWHNNHHTYPRSAKMGIRPGELDPGWWVIALLARVGLATDIILPGESARAAQATPVTRALALYFAHAAATPSRPR